MTRAGLAACGAVMLALLGVIAGELYGGDPAAERSAPVRPTPQRQPPRDGQTPSHVDQWVATSLQRPLFAPDRRAPARGSIASEGNVPRLPRLAGTLISSEGKHAVFAAEASDGKSAVISEGARIGAWTVRAIAAGEVTVAGPDGVRTLHPTFDPTPPPPAPPPVVQQPPEPVIPQPQLPPSRGRATVRPDR